MSVYLSSSNTLRLLFYYVCGCCCIINHSQGLEGELNLQSLKAWTQLSVTTPNFSPLNTASRVLSFPLLIKLFHTLSPKLTRLKIKILFISV